VGEFPSFVILAWAVLIFVPFWKLLPRHGISPYFAIAAIVPAFALILLWVMAFKPGRGGRA
jgi:hypothetical protein